MSKVFACMCKHKFQDERYGEGNRIHNFARKAKTNGGWRCTVCLHVKD